MSDGPTTPRFRDEFDDLVRRIGVYSWSTIGAVILILFGGYVLIEGRIIFAPLFIALIVVIVLNPFVSALQHRGVHRLIGAAIAFLGLLAALVAIGLLVIPSIADQARGFATEFPLLYDRFIEQVVTFGDRFGLDPSLWSYDQILEYLNDPENQDTILSIVFDRLGTLTTGIFEFILVFLLGPVIAFYVLIDLPNVQQRLLDMVPERNRAEVAYVGRRLNSAVGGFLRGQLVVAIIVGGMLSVGYWLIDLPFWMLVGMVGGVLNIVPFLGPWVGGILGVAIALTTADFSTAVWAVVVAVIVQQIDNNFVSPSVLRATVRLHPAVTLLVLVLAGAVAGFWGIVIAVPLAAALKIIFGYWWRTRILEQSPRDAAESMFIEPPKRKFWTREIEAVTIPTDDSDGDQDDA
ncbi:MAG: AI-2E family transporter [Actinomycetia bacterium]|nr:AI-2E family transporter [Actinomycetes bacterium]